MRTRRKNEQGIWAAIGAMLAAIAGIANAEESSILVGATMSTHEINIENGFAALADFCIAGSYKVMTMTDLTDS